MEFKGILKEKMAMQQGEKNGKTWQSRSFRVATIEEYPQIGIFDLFGDNCDLIDKYPLGVEINVFFSLKATNSADGKWFNKLKAWKVESEYKNTSQTSQVQKTELENNTSSAIDPAVDQNEENNDQLPF